MVGRTYADPAAVPSGVTVFSGDGYDGQFFFRLALDPFTNRKTDFGISFDAPGYRQQRIILPLFAWIFSGGGRSGAALWALISINALCYAAIAWIGARLAERIGRPALMGSLFVLVPGLLVALAFDTSEILGVVLVMGALLLIREQRFAWATLALAAAALTRETTLVVTAGLLLCTVGGRIRGRSYRVSDAKVPLTLSAVPIFAYVAWSAFLWGRWGHPSLFGTGQSGLTIPFLGLLRETQSWVARTPWRTGNFLFAVLSLAVFLAAVVSLPRSNLLDHERIALIFSIGLVLMLQQRVWFHFVGYLRAMSEAYVLSFMALLGRRDRAGWLTAAGLTPAFFYLGAEIRTIR